MNPDSGKWTRISVQVNRAGFSPCFRDGPACKSKWNLLLPEYKRIADYFLRTGTNSPDYWSLSVDARKAEGLPRSFPEEFFYGIHEWYGQRPTMQPPQVRDLQNVADTNCPIQSTQVREGAKQSASEWDTDDTMDDAFTDDLSTGNTSSSFSPPRPRTQTNFASVSDPFTARLTTTPVSSHRPRSSLPVGVVPHVISSSDTSGSTGVQF